MLATYQLSQSVEVLGYTKTLLFLQKTHKTLQFVYLLTHYHITQHSSKHNARKNGFPQGLRYFE